MSDDANAMILAALARIEAGQAQLRSDIEDRLDRFDRIEGKLDKVAADVAHVVPRMGALESDSASHAVRAAMVQSQLHALDVRVALLERRLELRDQA